MKSIVFVILMLSTSAVVADVPDYAKHVAPIFKKYCNGCHNADAREGKLVLEKYGQLLEGGEHGAVIVNGKSDESRLFRMISGTLKPVMPPEDEEKPTAEEITTIGAWIDGGAKGPEGAEPDPTILAVPKIDPTTVVADPLTALAVAPSGNLLAASRYGVVELLRRGDRSILHKLAGHRGRVTYVGFSADGGTLIAAAGEPGVFGEVRLWNVADGSLIRTFTGHRDSLYAAVLSPNGTILATSSYDQSVKLWDVASGKELRTLTGHNDAVYDLAFRNDGSVLASVSGDRTVKLWKVATGQRLDTLSQSLKELYAVAFRPDGKQIAAAGVDGRIRVWNVSADAKENTNPMVHNTAAHEGPVIRLTYSRDGVLLASTSEDRTIKLWDASTVSPRGTLEKQPDWAAALAIAPDGSSLFAGRLDGTQVEYPLGNLGKVAADATQLPTFPPVVWYGEQPAIAKLPNTTEIEPNDNPTNATAISAPGVATGVIKPLHGQSVDADLFRFEAKAGEQWILEINAARSSSKLDSRIEVLHADGQPVERLLLRAVRDSEVEFRSANSSTRSMRLANWEELELNTLVYLEGEVIKHYRQRRGPDADGDFYPETGDRYTFFDTSARTHALAAKCYFVEPYPVGTQLPYNGLPVFSLNYENDDDGQRKLGVDSRLTFTAPVDGSYIVRVTDVRGFGGDNLTYQLVVRRPQPAFNVSVSDQNPIVPAGSGKRINVQIDRIDGFSGEVRVDITGMPPGFFATTPIVVSAGHRDAHGVLFAHPNAPPTTDISLSDVKITATAKIGDREVSKTANNLGKIQLGPKPKLLVRLAVPGQPSPQPTGDVGSSLEFPHPPELTIAPEANINCQLSIERNGFNGIVNLEADNLPHGVIVDNIGLNGIQLLEGQTERTLSLSAERWVPDQDRLIQFYSKEEGVQVSLPLLLHVRKPAEVIVGQN